MAGLAALLTIGGLATAYRWPPLLGALAGMGGLALAVVAAELTLTKAHRRASTGLVWAAGPGADARRVGTKLVGIGAALALLALAYWLLPEYHGRFYAPAWNAAQLALVASPLLVAATIAYVWFLDARMREPHDNLYAAGRAVLSLGRAADLPQLRAFGLALLVKGFFVPLMFVYLCANMADLQTLATLTVWTPAQWFDTAWLTLFSIDLGFTTAGYLCAFRLIDTHIRSCEPTVGGWLVALVCYQPFWSLISATYIAYERPWTWGSLLYDQPLAYALVGLAILALSAVYAWATVCFGLRFSNLTYRGTVSWGPYRWTKHPAYLFKNASWWLIALPFLPYAGAVSALQACALLLLLNGIYYLRAKTEERHLMAYPEYRAYAACINANGAIARCWRRLAPSGTGQAPRSAE